MAPDSQSRRPFRKRVGRHRTRFQPNPPDRAVAFQRLSGATGQQNSRKWGRVAKVGLTDAELATLYASAGALAEPQGPLVRLLILTGQRRGEVAGMRWNELDLAAGAWSLPGERTKNGCAHSVPLTPEAVALLRTVKRRAGAALVFEGRRGTAFSGFGKLKDSLNAAMDAAAKEDGNIVPPWTIHDLRRTMATGMQMLGVRLEVTEALLNHVSGSRAGIAGVYQRYDWQTEKAASMRAWSTHVVVAAEGRSAAGNVVALRA